MKRVRGKKFLCISMVLMLIVSAALGGILVARAAPEKARIYIDDPAHPGLGYVPGAPTGTIIPIDIMIEITEPIDLVQWNLDMDVDPSAVKIWGIFDFYWLGFGRDFMPFDGPLIGKYATSIGAAELHLSGQVLPDGSSYDDVNLPLQAVLGDVPGCPWIGSYVVIRIDLEAVSETAYSPIDLSITLSDTVGVIDPATYVVEDGHYNPPPLIQRAPLYVIIAATAVTLIIIVGIAVYFVRVRKPEPT